MPPPRRWPTIVLLALLLSAGGGCLRRTYDPARATAPYPAGMARVETVDIQVFRENETIEIVNSTARSYRDVVVWINRRYARALETLPAGKSVRLSLWEFYDELGEVFSAGGFLRTTEPTPLLLVELQLPDRAGMVGLIAIRSGRTD